MASKYSHLINTKQNGNSKGRRVPHFIAYNKISFVADKEGSLTILYVKSIHVLHDEAWFGSSKSLRYIEKKQ